jgi:hypothetical protein
MSNVLPIKLVACFSNDRLGLTANVREVSEIEFEVAVIDAFSGGVVVSRSFSTKDAAVETARLLVQQAN